MLLNQQNTQFQLKQVPVPLTPMRAQLSCTIKRKNGSSHMNDVSSKCVFCNGHHKLDMSVGFGTFGEVRRTTDCQMYLKEGHRSRSCKQNKYYSIQYSHPTLLHDDSRSQKEIQPFLHVQIQKYPFMLVMYMSQRTFIH